MQKLGAREPNSGRLLAEIRHKGAESWQILGAGGAEFGQFLGAEGAESWQISGAGEADVGCKGTYSGQILGAGEQISGRFRAQVGRNRASRLAISPWAIGEIGEIGEIV